jgi:hypothetical protein
MMRQLFAFILVCLLAAASPARAAEKIVPAQTESLSPEDLKVVAMMEILQLMDLAEEMDMCKDLNYLIEEKQNGNQND